MRSAMRTSEAPSALSRAAVFSNSWLSRARMTAMARSLSMRHSWMTQVPTALLAAFKMTLSPFMICPWSSSRRYATHISPARDEGSVPGMDARAVGDARSMAAYSMGRRSVGILMTSFSFHVTSDCQVPMAGLLGMTQSFSERNLTPGPTLTTTARPSLPATKGGFSPSPSG